MKNQKTVIIVGAGPSGLVALKEMRAAGHIAFAFEKGKSIGGVFAEHSSIAYDQLFLTTSNCLIAYSDFPPLEPRPKYSSKEEYWRYLEAYADHFELRQFIQFEAIVRQAVLCKRSGMWKVLVENNGTFVEHIADALIVASGAYQTSSTPCLSGYTGEVVHSKDYRSAKGFEGKRVLVMGIGESSVDIAGELADCGAKTIVYSRRPFVMAPRFPFKALLDKNYDEMSILSEKSNENDQACVFLEAFSTNRLGQLAPLYLYAWLRRIMLKMGATGMFGKRFAMASKWALFGPQQYQARADSALIVTKNGRNFKHAANGTLDMIVSKDIRFNERTISFPSTVLHNADTFEEARLLEFTDVDVIVCCTGFKTNFDWLEHGAIKVTPRSWYKHCFVPGYGSKLMILGMTRPHQGGIPPCSEMLSRYGAMILSGDRDLPPDYAARALEEGELERRFFAATPHICALIDFPSFMNSLARHIGCTPTAPNFLLNPIDAFKYWVYPNWPCWYRQRGPGANPKALSAVLAKCPLYNSVKLSHSGGFLLAEIIVFLLSRPIYFVAFLFSYLTKFQRRGMTPAWMFLKPRSSILHCDEIPTMKEVKCESTRMCAKEECKSTESMIACMKQPYCNDKMCSTTRTNMSTMAV